MRILVVSSWFPYPADNGARRRILNLIKQLSTSHQISLCAYHEPQSVPEDAAHAHLANYCEGVITVPRRVYSGHGLASLGALARLQPPWIKLRWSDRMTAAVSVVIEDWKPDLLLISQIGNLPLLDDLKIQQPVILEQFEVGTIWQRVEQRNGFQRLRSLGARYVLSAYLRRSLRRLAAVTVPSEREGQILAAVLPSAIPICEVPNGVDTEEFSFRPLPIEEDLLVYNGSLEFAANRDAVRYFLGEIMPLIVRHRPKTRLRVTGHVDSAISAEYEGIEHLELTGFVPDVRDVVASAEICVIPLRHGSGTRLKALESMALGVPIVSTSLGIGGLKVSNGVDCLVADSPNEFAQHVLSLLGNTELNQEIARNARLNVISNYRWHDIGNKLNSFCESVSAMARAET